MRRRCVRGAGATAIVTGFLVLVSPPVRAQEGTEEQVRQFPVTALADGAARPQIDGRVDD